MGFKILNSLRKTRQNDKPMANYLPSLGMDYSDLEYELRLFGFDVQMKGDRIVASQPLGNVDALCTKYLEELSKSLLIKGVKHLYLADSVGGLSIFTIML